MKIIISVVLSIFIVACGNDSSSKKDKESSGFSDAVIVQSVSSEKGQILTSSKWCNSQNFLDEDSVEINLIIKMTFSANGNANLVATENNTVVTNENYKWALINEDLVFKFKGETDSPEVIIEENRFTMVGAIETEEENGSITLEDMIYEKCE